MSSSTLRRVLLVEDEADIQLIARLALENIGGFEVLICSSGQEALDKAPGFEPQLVLLDVMMPGLDGPATLAGLRRLPGLADVPMVFVTAKAQRNEIERYRSLGVLDVIVKPFDPLTLSDQVRELWLRHREGGDA